MKLGCAMRPQFASPGVKNSVKSDGGAQAFGVVPEVQQGRGRFFKQQVVHHLPVILADGVEHMGQCKHTMMIRYRHKVINPCLNPAMSCDVVSEILVF